AYEAAGLTKPPYFVWCDSPLAGCYVEPIIEHLKKEKKGSGHITVTSPLQAIQSFPEPLQKKLKEAARNQLGNIFWGNLDAGWLSFYDVFRRSPIADTVAKMDGLFGLARNCGAILPYDEACVMTERATAIHRDAEGRLHCETGQAVAYADGF